MEVAQTDYGCSHYKRRSKFLTPCCKNFYHCRFCHDDAENHKLNRKDVVSLQCTNCLTVQKVQDRCDKCNILFGKYSCLKCKLFDDEDKKQYHCDQCGICRVGGQENFFHCAVCGLCLPRNIRYTHKCVENVSHSDCAICLEDIHSSRVSCHIPKCGHLLHLPCFEQLLHSGHSSCPVCQTSLLDMTEMWNSLDNEISRTPMPPEYRDFKVNILCRDCHEKSNILFHLVGLKCASCGSYNTCRIDDTPRRDSGR